MLRHLAVVHKKDEAEEDLDEEEKRRFASYNILGVGSGASHQTQEAEDTSRRASPDLIILVVVREALSSKSSTTFVSTGAAPVASADSSTERLRAIE